LLTELSAEDDNEEKNVEKNVSFNEIGSEVSGLYAIFGSPFFRAAYSLS
jgi:hypothetical protein